MHDNEANQAQDLENVVDSLQALHDAREMMLSAISIYERTRVYHERTVMRSALSNKTIAHSRAQMEAHFAAQRRRVAETGSFWEAPHLIYSYLAAQVVYYWWDAIYRWFPRFQGIAKMRLMRQLLGHIQ